MELKLTNLTLKQDADLEHLTKISELVEVNHNDHRVHQVIARYVDARLGHEVDLLQKRIADSEFVYSEKHIQPQHESSETAIKTIIDKLTEDFEILD